MRKHAWDAGQLIFDAHVVLKGKRTALHAAFLAGQKHAARAKRRRRGVNQWQREIDDRRPGRTQGEVIAAIATREGLKPDSIKKQLQRRRRRTRQSASQKSRGQNRR